MKIKLKKLDENAIMPTNGTKYSAGYDLYALTKTGVQRVLTGQTEKIGTGISVAIPEGYFGAIFARSGLATKQGLRPANCVGVIDADYRGEIIVALHNDSNECKSVHDGDRIAQLVVLPYLSVEFEEVEELEDTERGDNGFGSTGVS